MIKIYDRPFVNDPKDDIYFYDITSIRYNFYEDDTNLHAEIFISYESDNYDETEGSYQVTINKNQYAGQIMMISLSRPNLKTIYTNISYATRYERLLGEVYNPKLFPKVFNAISLFIPQDYINNPILIMPHMRTNMGGNRVDGCDYEEVELINKDPQSTLISLSEEASIKKDAWLIKKQQITPLLDPYESISYLEGQVDVLTKVIKMLVEKTGLDLGEYKEVIDSIDNNNLISIKPLDIINSEILKDKSRARNVQKGYYLAKYGQL